MSDLDQDASAPFYTGNVRTIWRLFAPHRRRFVAGLAARVGVSLAAAVPLVILVWVIERIRTETLTGAELGLAIAVVLTGVAAQYGFTYLANRSSWTTTFYAVGDARVETLEHIRRLPLGTIGDRGAGDLSAVLTSDMETVSGYGYSGLPLYFSAISLPLFVFTGLLLVDAPMAAAVAASVLAAIPAVGWLSRFFGRRALERGNIVAAAGGRMIEYVQGIAVVRALDRTGERFELFRAAVDDVRRVSDRLAVRLAPAGMAAMAILQLGIPLTLAALTYRYLGGLIDAGAVLVFLVLVLRVYAPLLELVGSLEQAQLAKAALRRVGAVRDLRPQPTPNAPTGQGVEEPSIRLEDVSFGYASDQPVLDRLSLEVPPRTMTALVGPSGAGKSTVLALIARFYDVDAGAVRLGDADVRDLTAEQLFDAVTVVFQDVYLFSGTVRDNIAFGHAHTEDPDGEDPDAAPTDDASIEAAARKAQAHEFIMALPQGYDTQVGEGGALLSGGERQRISIARAIWKDAPIVLLDEATAALDPINERAVQLAFAELLRERTVLVVAHRLSTIRAADQIVVLDGGRIAERGRHDELLAAEGQYAAMVRDRERAARWRVGRTRSIST